MRAPLHVFLFCFFYDGYVLVCECVCVCVCVCMHAPFNFFYDGYAFVCVCVCVGGGVIPCLLC